jgi:pimeloyl-ACP methyl ester carboxylesterase
MNNGLWHILQPDGVDRTFRSTAQNSERLLVNAHLGPPRAEPVVLVPGFMADARAFMPQLAELGATRPVILLTPGLGDSLERIASEAAAQLPPRFALVGHGLGGNLAIEILRKAPQAVSRIVLIATDPLPEPPQLAAAQEALLVAAKTGHMADCIAQMLPAAALYPAPWRDEVLALVHDMAATLGPDQFQRQLRLMQRRPDQQKTLRKANVPTMILAGAADTIVPRRRAEFLAAMMPQGCLEIIPEAGHLPQLEQPQAVTAALQTFLAGRLPTLILG